MTKRTTLARAATVSARVVVGAAVSGAAVLAVIAATTVPWPTLVASPARLDVTPAASDTTVSCAGPLLAVGRQAEQALTFSVAADPRVTAGAVGADVDPVVRELRDATIGNGASSLTVAPSGDAPTVFAAASSASVDDDDLRGFAASACQPAAMEAWIVAGATTTGASDLIVLANPGQVSASVDLTVYGADAPRVPPGGAGVVVPPASQVVIALSGLIRAEENPVVRVTATGAPVRAVLQSSSTDTLVAEGVEQTGSILLTGVEQVVPGIRIPGPTDGDAGVRAALRVLAPDADAVADVTLHSSDAEDVTRTMELKAGIPGALDLTDLPAGSYTAVVRASAAVVASGWASTPGDGARDFAWYTAAPALTGETEIAVAPGPGAELTLANPSTTSASVEVVTDARSATVTVPPRGQTTVPLRSASVARLVTDGTVHAGVGYHDDTRLSAYAVWPNDAAAPRLVVLP